MEIGVSDLVKRQTVESKFAHFDGSWRELAHLARAFFDRAKPGYRDGVVLVPVHPRKFFTSITPVKENTTLWARFKARRPGEAPHLSTVALRGSKTPAKYVELVLYRADVLDEGNERTTDADWEIVSINASPTLDPVPMSPYTMARNQCRLKGGTKGNYSSEEWAESVEFWSRHVMVEPK